MVLVFNLIVLLATIVSMSRGYNVMPQFQSKFRKCVACTVLISSMGTSLPSISFADEVSRDLAAPVATSLFFKSFLITKKDLTLEEEVKRAEKEAEEDAKAAKIERARERYFEYEAKQADAYEFRIEEKERKAAAEVQKDEEEVLALKAAEAIAEKEAKNANTKEEKAKKQAVAKKLAEKLKEVEKKEKKALEAERLFLAEEIQGKKIMAAKDAAARAEEDRLEKIEKLAAKAAAKAAEEEALLKERPKSSRWSF